jgi:hypothetical protein
MTKPGFEVESMQTHVDLEDNVGRIFSRDCAHYAVRTPSGPVLHVLVNHFKSQSGGGGTRRQRQAAAVRSIATELVDAGESVVVLGDLNEGPETAGEPPTNLATLFDPAGPLRSCYDLPGFDVGPRLGTFDSCGLSNRLDYIFISADLPARFRGGSVLRSGLWGSRKTRPTAWTCIRTSQLVRSRRPTIPRCLCASTSKRRASTSGVAPLRRTGLTARSGYLLDGFVELVGCQIGDVAAGCAHTRRVPPPAIVNGGRKLTPSRRVGSRPLRGQDSRATDSDHIRCSDNTLRNTRACRWSDVSDFADERTLLGLPPIPTNIDTLSAVSDRFAAGTLAKCDPFGTPSTSHWTGAAIIEQSLRTKTCIVTGSRTSNRPMPFSLAG